jgi:hypothetical protein
MMAKVLLQKKVFLVVNVKELGAKKNWLAVNCQSLSNSDFDSAVIN